jgi:hypothetical protein
MESSLIQIVLRVYAPPTSYQLPSVGIMQLPGVRVPPLYAGCARENDGFSDVRFTQAWRIPGRHNLTKACGPLGLSEGVRGGNLLKMEPQVRESRCGRS